MYRLVLGELGFFDRESENFDEDPFKESKDESLTSAIGSFKDFCLAKPNPELRELVQRCLWGNRSDLSLSSGVVEDHLTKNLSGVLLSDDLDEVETYWYECMQRKTRGSYVIMILDNCGAELLADLLLARFFARTHQVVLHVKAHPVFVSDATIADVHFHVERLKNEDIACGNELHELMTSDRIKIETDLFYTCPLEFALAPLELKNKYSSAALVVVKGDANYRRMLGDRMLHHLPLGAFTGLFSASALLALRTCKSPVYVNIAQVAKLAVESENKNWCVDGTCGVIQFVSPVLGGFVPESTRLSGLSAAAYPFSPSMKSFNGQSMLDDDGFQQGGDNGGGLYQDEEDAEMYGSNSARYRKQSSATADSDWDASSVITTGAAAAAAAAAVVVEISTYSECGLPRKTTSAFHYFCLGEFAQRVEDAKPVTVISANKRWKTCEASMKKLYEAKADADKARYLRELVEKASVCSKTLIEDKRKIKRILYPPTTVTDGVVSEKKKKNAPKNLQQQLSQQSSQQQALQRELMDSQDFRVQISADPVIGTAPSDFMETGSPSSPVMELSSPYLAPQTPFLRGDEEMSIRFDDDL